MWTLSGVLEFKTIFVILRVIYLSHCIDICTGGTKPMVGTIAGTFAQIRAVAPNYTIVIVFFPTTKHSQFF